MELKELLPAIDKAVDTAIAAKKDYDSVVANNESAITKAKMQFDSLVTSCDKQAILVAQKLESANSAARALQEELQLKTTSFLNTNNSNVKQVG